MASAVDVESSSEPHAADLVHDVIDEGVLPADRRELPLEAGRDRPGQAEAADEMPCDPITAPLSTGGGVGGAAKRHDGHDREHPGHRERKGRPLELRASRHESLVESVHLDHLAAPAARADEVGDRQAVDEHHHQGREHAGEAVHGAPAEDGRVGHPVEIAQPEAETGGRGQEHQREQGGPCKHLLHGCSDSKGGFSRRS